MPLLTPGDVHVNTPLTNISVAYAQEANRFVADRVFPRVPVQKQSDRYFRYLKGDWFREEVSLRAPGAESSGSGWRIDNTPTYYCDVYAVHKDVDDQLRANVDTPLQLDRDSTRWVTNQLLLKREKDFISTYMATSVWGKDKQGVAASPTGNQFIQWDQGASTPIEDIHAEIVYITQTTGVDPNSLTLVVGPEVHNVLRDHPTIIDRIKYGQTAGSPAIVSENVIAQLFGVNRYMVAWATNNTAAEPVGQTENAAMSFITGKTALLVYTPNTPSLMEPAGGYIFTWTGLFGAGAFGNRIRRFRLERNNSDRIEGEMAYDMKVVAADVGVYWYDVVA